MGNPNPAIGIVSALPVDDVGLFDVDVPPVTLADRFVFPPFSILDRRSGEWQARRRRWLSLGIRSEVGREASLTYAKSRGTDPMSLELLRVSNGVSIFDPVVCELVYRWFSRPGARVLDPFAGGSVRGVIASTLARWYMGLDIRQEQIAANREQLHLCSDIAPQWITGDATRLNQVLSDGDEFDLVFSCPPYTNLEVYSDHPRDISTWSYDEFIAGHHKVIQDACSRLRPNRYAAWMIGDVRDKSGRYYGLHHRTVEAFRDAGLRVINECVLVDPPGGAAVRAARPFQVNRKLALVHQHLLVFVKGDVRKAADWATTHAIREEAS